MNWISVKDELPSKGQKVLCVQNPKTTATKEALYAVFDGKDFMTEKQTTYANFEIGKSVWSDIIYWMPLPKTPNS